MKARTVFILYAVIILWMVLPLIPVTLACIVADACGARLDEAGAHPCIVFGVDIGGVLNVMFVLGWLGLVTFPTGIVAWMVVTIIAVFTHRSKGSGDSDAH